MKIVVLGAGGHAKVIIDIIRRQKEFKADEIDLLDDGVKVGTLVEACKVKGAISEAATYPADTGFVIAIGDNSIRKGIAEMYDLNYKTLIHPNAIIGSNVSIGRGTVVMAGAVINSGAVIGDHCIINSGVTVDHDNILSDFVHISPGAHLGGMVQIGKESWIGIGSCVKNNVEIAENVIIGAGGVVIRNIKEKGVYVGVPVRKIMKGQ